MNLLWPRLLFSFLLIPLIVVFYIWILRRIRRFAVPYSTLMLIRAALPKRSRWRRHVPFVLFLLGLISLTTALARPAAEVEVPLSRTTIILALDVSRSMGATDVNPNRLSVAKEAALAFIEDQADGTQIGIVAFAEFAEIVVPPTNDKELLREAVRNFTTSIGTAIGSATLKSIDAISEINPAVTSSGLNLSTEDSELGQEEVVYQSDIIVLLTDGANTHGPQPLDVAKQAAGRQVRLYTIGFGTTEFSGRFLSIDEPTLQDMADITGGSYFRAESADQLFEIFRNLPTQFVLQKENLEISVIFLALGAVFVTAAVVLSLLWNQFP